MLRTLLIGIWVTAVALASTYAGANWKLRSGSGLARPEHAEKLGVKKVKPITAPVIVGGELKGYVSAEFSFVEDSEAAKRAPREPEAYFMDEAFRLIYTESNIDFQHIEKIDINTLTRKITERVNERLGAGVVKETLVKNLTFTARENLPH